jgi:hypothetical protein
VPALIRRAHPAQSNPLDPRGRIHVPIGLPDTVDTLKTFVEAEGNFSPGVGSYGIYFWLFDVEAGRLTAPTMEGVPLKHGLAPGGLLIPWSEWQAGDISVRTEVCEVEIDSPAGKIFVVGARAGITNTGTQPRKIAVYAALRPLGAAGFDVGRLDVASSADALMVDGRAAIVADRKPSGAGVVQSDTIGDLAMAGKLPDGARAQSETGDCSGALRFDWSIRPNGVEHVGFICPVLPARRAARHQWIDRKQNAMVDAAELNPKSGGIPQPDPGLSYYRELRAATLFDKATSYWSSFLGRIDIEMPDPRWGESMRAILAHAGLCMNEGAPDVAVVNYNVFNRDGMYIANIMQKSGLSGYSERVLQYFIAHPFNGRAYPEADNPGQILWAIHQHWLLTRDRAWLQRIYPSATKIAEMIRYCRTSAGPHWVSTGRLEFGDALPLAEREELKPGRCDGFHPEYTEAFDIAGLRGAGELAEAAGNIADARRWRSLAESLFHAYDEKFGARLPRQYGSYAVLWPCGLYPYDRGRAREQFRETGAQKPTSWRYFPLATAHQGLFAGNRAAGHGTLEIHLGHEQMQGWYVFDEGGGSGSGGWYRTRTTWTHDRQRPGDNRSVAMPHGWAIAELWLLMRDSIVFEDRGRLVLFAGVPEAWFRDAKGMRARRLATCFGSLDISYAPAAGGAVVSLSDAAAPPNGFLLRLPASLGGDRTLKPAAGKQQIRFS